MFYEQERLQNIFRKYGAMAVIFDDGNDAQFETVSNITKDREYDLSWIKRQIDDEAWRKLSEQERQRLLMQAKLLERMLRKELYGDDWRRRLAALEGDEAAIRELEV